LEGKSKKPPVKEGAGANQQSWWNRRGSLAPYDLLSNFKRSLLLDDVASERPQVLKDLPSFRGHPLHQLEGSTEAMLPTENVAQPARRERKRGAKYED
jgi:hypothetical protein